MITLTVKERVLPFSDIELEISGKRYTLHPFQKVFYSDMCDLPQVTVVVAPTGAGKTFAFMLPIIYARHHNSVPPRGLIIAPTNALVDDMYRSFKDFAKVEKITGTTLQTHGIKRPQELIEKVKSANIIVTNPDIVNFVIHGGYHIDDAGNKVHILHFQDWTEFFGKIDYIIFDEYHLYDEEQIANVLIWLITNYQFFKHLKWFFVSATPDQTLINRLNEQKIEYKIVRDEIVSEELATSGRIIQGRQKIHFIDVSESYSLYKWLFSEGEIRSEVKENILHAIENNKKVFVLFDSLREAKMAENKMREIFRNVKIGVNTGFETRQKNFNFYPEEYDIIITTSKAEVGVNYPVHIAYIDSGRYLRNFLQRIGRIGRNEDDSEIYCITPINIVEKINRYIKNCENISYYEFTDIMIQSFEDVKRKEERIPPFMGALLWSVYNALESRERKKMLEELFHQFQYSKILLRLDNVIRKAKEEMDEEFYENLTIFWNAFKKSWMRFREHTIQWKIFYNGQETEYDIIWVLNNAFIEDIDKEKKKIVISDFRPKNEKVVKGIITHSLLGDPFQTNNFQRIGGEGKNEEEWRDFLYSDHIGRLYRKKLEEWLREVCVSKELEDLLRKLEPLYSKKRIEILDVLYDAGKITEDFII